MARLLTETLCALPFLKVVFGEADPPDAANLKNSTLVGRGAFFGDWLCGWLLALAASLAAGFGCELSRAGQRPLPLANLSFGIGFLDWRSSFPGMDEEPKEPSKVRTIYMPVVIATIFACVLWFGVPEIGALAVGSAWVGTVLFMSIWGSFYS